MATLTPTLTLTSTDATADPLSITVTHSLTTTNPAVNIARAAVLHTGETVLIASSVGAVNYVYLKNIDTSNFITVKTDAAAVVMKLSPGEFAFLPLNGSVGLEAQADTATCVLEYAYWTKG
tara:strand:- start:869 stop:1231 length:363 start_codon:yes stop_codon:yes gene_type:complete